LNSVARGVRHAASMAVQRDKKCQVQLALGSAKINSGLQK
jgi:hypothetical protein